MKKTTLFLFTILCAGNIFAQVKDVAVIKLLEKGYLSSLDSDFITSLQHIEKAIAISKPKNDYTALAYEYAYKSMSYTHCDSVKEANKSLNLSFFFAKKAKDNLAYATYYFAVSTFYKHNDLLDLSVQNAKKGIDCLKNNKDYRLLSALNWDLYYAYEQWGKLDKVKKYSQLALENAEKSNNIKCKIDAYYAKVIYFDNRYSITKSQKFKDSILYFRERMITLCENHPREMGYETYARMNINLASISYALLPKNLESKKKIYQYLNLVEITVKNHQLKYDYLTNVYGIKGGYAEEENDFATAENYYLIAEKKILKQKNIPYYTLFQAYKALTSLYEKKKDFVKALTYQKKLQAVKDELNNQEQIKNNQKLEILYGLEKKDIELKRYKEREESIKMKNYLYLGIIIITILSFIFMFRSYHYKLKYSSQRERELEAKKQEAELQVILEKKEKERLQLEQELLSIKQNQLQKEVLTNNLQLSRKKEMLEQIKLKINKGETNEAKKIIREEIFVDNEFEETKSQLQKIHPTFFNVLNEKSTQKLSQLDMKYCVYLHLQMNTKQIANLLHIEPKSVRVAKYRIKQKLMLDKDEDLDSFLINIK